MNERLSLYVHIPFCRSKCAYCDFNSYAGQEELIPSYGEALLREAAVWSGSCVGATVETVYFGGGTPSLVPLAEMERLVDGLRRLFEIVGEAEISLEANPESVDLAHLQGLRELGVNRLSLGVQSFDEGELRSLERIHTAAQAEAAFDAARQAGFENVGLDLLFGLAQQRLSQWRRSLEKALRLGPEHLSLYALTVEEDTPLARAVAEGRAREPDADVQAEMYAWSEERMAAAGYEHYEISNWARPGHRCRHNETYWRNQPYLGLGAGAHSYIGGYRFANESLPSRYIELVEGLRPPKEQGESPVIDPSSLPQVTAVERLDEQTDMADTLILGLRLTEGVSLRAFRQRFGMELTERYSQEIADLTGLGLLEVNEGHLRLTRRGHLLANEAFQRFLP